jgi:hypothetical protein
VTQRRHDGGVLGRVGEWQVARRQDRKDDGRRRDRESRARKLQLLPLEDPPVLLLLLVVPPVLLLVLP